MPEAAFSPALFTFLKELRANNDRGWFEANRGRYEELFLEPALEFIEAFAPHLRKISAEFVASPQPLQVAGADHGVEHLGAAPSRLFGLVHGRIRMPDHVFGFAGAAHARSAAVPGEGPEAANGEGNGSAAVPARRGLHDQLRPLAAGLGPAAAPPRADRPPGGRARGGDEAAPRRAVQGGDRGLQGAPRRGAGRRRPGGDRRGDPAALLRAGARGEPAHPPIPSSAPRRTSRRGSSPSPSLATSS